MPDAMNVQLPRDLVLAFAEIQEAFRDYSYAFLVTDPNLQITKLAGAAVGMERAILRTRAAVARLDKSKSATAPVEEFDTTESVEAMIARIGPPLGDLEVELNAMLRRLIKRLEPFQPEKKG